MGEATLISALAVSTVVARQREGAKDLLGDAHGEICDRLEGAAEEGVLLPAVEQTGSRRPRRTFSGSWRGRSTPRSGTIILCATPPSSSLRPNSISAKRPFSSTRGRLALASCRASMDIQRLGCEMRLFQSRAIAFFRARWMSAG